MRLSLAEDIVLLGMDDDKGTLVLNASPDFKVCVAAAILTDLYLEGNFRVNGDSLIKESEPKQSFLQKAYQKIKDGANVKNTLSTIIDDSDPLDTVIERLTSQDILARETKKVLFLKKEMYPTENPDPENATRYNLFQVVFENQEPDTRILFLLFFIKAGNLISEVFRKRQSEAADVIDNLIESGINNVLSLEEKRYFNSLVAAMQKRMMLSISFAKALA